MKTVLLLIALVLTGCTISEMDVRVATALCAEQNSTLERVQPSYFGNGIDVFCERPIDNGFPGAATTGPVFFRYKYSVAEVVK